MPTQHTATSVKGTKSLPIDVDAHAENEPPRAGPSKQAASTKKQNTIRPSFPCTKETDNFWHAGQTTPPPPSFVPGSERLCLLGVSNGSIDFQTGLILLMKQGLTQGHSCGSTRKAVLCDSRAVLTYRQPWDATWGCGYRNYMMCCASLITQDLQPLYFPLIDSPLPPSIRNLQRWIEDAWMHGFDPVGQSQLKSLVGKKKWIGTADLWVAFTYMGIPAQLVDFEDVKKSPKQLKALQNWVVDYFTPSVSVEPSNAFDRLKTSSIVVTDKMPLILQHAGHSRTIVGYEMDRNGEINLLTFDPAYRPTADIQKAAESLFINTLSQSGSDVSTSVVGEKRKRVDEEVKDQTALGPSCSPNKKVLTFGWPHSDASLRLLKESRITTKHLAKKNAYQILYFPMTAPLTEAERMRQRVPNSIRITG